MAVGRGEAREVRSVTRGTFGTRGHRQRGFSTAQAVWIAWTWRGPIRRSR